MPEFNFSHKGNKVFVTEPMPKSYKQLFKACGWDVVQLGERIGRTQIRGKNLWRKPTRKPKAKS